MPRAIGEDSIGELVSLLRVGNRDAVNHLMEALYPDLRRLAAARMRRERPGHTLQPTALVNELYLELMKVKALQSDGAELRERRHAFFGLAGYMMMRLLIHHARPLYRRIEKAPLSVMDETSAPGFDTLTEIEELLCRLAAIDPQLRAVVEMKVFEGCSTDEIADRLACGSRTVERRWHFAKHWLERELSSCRPG